MDEPLTQWKEQVACTTFVDSIINLATCFAEACEPINDGCRKWRRDRAAFSNSALDLLVKQPGVFAAEVPALEASAPGVHPRVQRARAALLEQKLPSRVQLLPVHQSDQPIQWGTNRRFVEGQNLSLID